MQSLEVGLTLVAIVIFAFGWILGFRGRREATAEVVKLKAKLKATDVALNSSLIDVRSYRIREEGYMREKAEFKVHLDSRDKLLGRIEEHLKRDGLTYDKTFGNLRPVRGEDFRFEISVIRLPQEEIDARHKREQALEEQRYERAYGHRPVEPVPERRNRPLVTSAETHYGRHNSRDDNLFNAAMTATVMCAVADSSHSSRDSSPCESPNHDTGGGCSDPSFD